MSYSSDYFNAMNKRKKKEEEENKSKSSNKSFATEYFEAVQNNISADLDDIAPVRSTVIDTEEKKTDDRTWFQKGAFDDGYQFGDVTKTLVGTLTDINENINTAVVDATENLIDTTAYGIGAVGGLFNKDFKDDVGKFIAKEILQPEKTGETLTALTSPLGLANKILNKGETEENSVLGEKADGLVQSGAHLVGSAALQAVGVPTWLTMGVNAFGGEIESAFQNDATYLEAGISGGISAVAEIFFEKISSGIKFKSLGGTWDEGLQNFLKNNISNKVGRTIAKYVTDMGFEGTEEVLTEATSEIGRRLTYMSEKGWNEILSKEEAFDAFIGGAAISGIAGGGQIINSARNGTDYTTGLTANEEKVVKKLYDDKIAESQKSGKKLKSGEKAKIYDGIVEELKKGYISTDTIEGVLGGKTFEEYKNLTEQEKSLTDEISQLENLPKEQITVKQSERLTAAREELKNLTNKDELKSRLTDGVKGLIDTESQKLKSRGSYLAESYNEVARKGQAFEADLTQYKGKQKAAYERAIKSGVLNNTNRSHELVDTLAKIEADKGIVFDYANNAKLKETGFALDGKTVNAFVKNNAVTLNVQSQKAWQSTVGHEITHILEGTESYTELQSALFKYAESKGELASRKATLTELYNGIDADIDAELTADLVGDYLFSDSDFVKNLTGNKNLFQKIYDEIKYLCKVATGKELTEIEKVKREFDKVWKEYSAKGAKTESESGIKYHISENFEAEIDKTLNNEMSKNNQVKARDFTPEILVKNGVNNLPMLITQNHIKSIVYSETEAKKLGLPTGKNKNYHGLGKELLVKSIDNMDSPLEIYKQDKNHYLIITELQNSNGEDIIIPVKIDGKGTYNDVYIDENQILSAYGKKNLQDYLKKNNFELIYTKKGTALNEGVQYSDISDSSLQTAESRVQEKYSFNQQSVSEDIVTENSNDVKTQFSLSKSVEETKNLVALHNLNADKLNKVIDLGGFPMPSIAVTKTDIPHTNFGDITLVMNKSTIDPKANRKNTVYSADAWTPTVPRTEYKPNDSRLREISNRVNELVGDRKILNALDYVAFDTDNVSRDLDQTDGNLANKYLNNNTMKYAFLKDIGAKVEMPTKEAALSRGVSNEAVRYFSGKLVNGLHTVELYQNMSATEMMKDDDLKNAVAEVLNWDILRQFEEGTENHEKLKANPVYKADELSFSQIDSLFNGARKYFNHGIEQTVDGREAKNVIGNYFNENNLQEQYENWLNQMFEGVVEKTGIYNNKDIFTPSGNRRTFEQLHLPVTLDNIVKAMASQNNGNTKNVAGFNGVKTLRAGMAERFKSIDDMHKLESRLQHLTEEEFEAIHDQLADRMYKIINSVLETAPETSGNIYMRQDSVGETLMEIAESGNYSTDAIQKTVNQYIYNIDESIAEEIRTLLYDVSQMPTNMFEAKPERAVGFDEVNAVILPNTTDNSLRERLANMGVKVVTYEKGSDADRLNKLNSLLEEQPDWKFSLSKKGEQFAPVGNYSTPLNETALAPIREDIAENATPTETVAENVTTEVFPDDYSPLTEEEANALQSEQFESITDADAPPEVAPTYYGDQVDPESPFNWGEWDKVGDRKKKAYMYENPEVKPFFQAEAEAMLSELQNSTKGERWFNDKLYYDTNGEHGWGGISRMTSNEIALLLDSDYKYSYADIEKGLKAIIEDNGKENNAISKRIEFLLDERLRQGYTDFQTGIEIPANQDYINLLNAKQITEYSDEAFNNWLSTLTAEDFKTAETEAEQYADDYAPTKEAVSPVIDVAPITEAEANAIQDEKAKADANAEGQPKSRKQLHHTIIENIKSVFSGKGFEFDEVLKKAKNLSTFSTVDNTPQRVMEKALGYKEGQTLADITVNKVAQNETEGIKWLNSFTDRKNGLLAQLSKQYNIKSGSKESAAAQMYAEGFYVNKNNDIVAYGDAELAQDFPDAKVRNNIKGLASDPRIRQIYDETLTAINESRTRNAYPEIQKLDNYFLHFRAMDDTFSRLGLPFNPNDIRAKDLPTDLNGVTADLKPGQPYFASANHRTGKRTSFDLLGGLERYLTSAKNQIYHIDDIQTLRALRNYIADTYGQANGLEGIDALTEEEAQERIEQVYNSHLSTFAKFLNEEANVLAGKTSLSDRGIEGKFGRRFMTFLDTVRKQTGSNMVGFNISSSLTNFIPVAQTFAKTNKFDFIKAFAQTVSNKFGSVVGKGDNFAENSPVIIRRKGADRFYRTPFQKAADAGYVFMSAVDDISTELIARTKFNELTRKGMSEQQAHFETDKWVSRLMGDRSLGQMPQLYNSKSLGVLTQFQLEVRNQLDSQFYDTIQEAKASNEDIENGLARNAKTAAKVTSTFVQLAVVQHLFGKAFESVAGYNPAFDIISVIATALGLDDDDESEDTALDNIEQGFFELLEDLPYTSALTGGRIPILSALPITELIKGEDSYGNEKSRWDTIKETLPYYLLPTGYGQIKKTAKGLSMFNTDEEHPVAGSYTDSGNLRFPVEDTLGNRIQAGIFGQYASKNAREYFDNNYAPLKDKQIQEFIDTEMPIADYWKYLDGLNALQPLEGKKTVSLNQKGDYIGGLDLPVSVKNILINNIADRDTPIDFTGYENYSNFEEFDFASRYPEKYEVLKQQGISVSDYKKNYEESAFMYTDDFSWAANNPEKYTVSKAVTDDVIQYKQYTTELYNIKADKDSSGKSITGSRKAKVVDYVNSLDLDYGAKLILFKAEYPSDDTYNADIVDYLNNREDLTYDERVTIYTELGFTVKDGYVYWD